MLINKIQSEWIGLIQTYWKSLNQNANLLSPQVLPGSLQISSNIALSIYLCQWNQDQQSEHI